MSRWARLAVVPLALAAMIALSAVVLGRVYADDLLTRLMAGAAIGSVAVGVLLRRLPNWVVAPLSAVLLFGYTALALKLAADHAELTGPFPQLVREALVNGIPRLLTAMIPVEPTPDTVLVPVAAAWVAGLAATEIGVRAGRVLFGCLPPVLLYAAALYVVGPNAPAAGLPTVGFAALAVLALTVSAGSPSPDAGLDDLPPQTRAAVRARTLGAAVAGLVAVLGLVAVAGPWVGRQVSATPVDPRRYVEPPQVDSLDESPLNRISGWALDPRQPLLRVQAAPAPATPAATIRLRLAVLPDYDGITWRVGAVYRNAGRVLPPPPELPQTEVSELRQDITVDGLTGRLLPAAPAPTAVSGARIAYDPGTGTLIRPEKLTPGLRYTVTSRVQRPNLDLLPTAEAPAGDAVVRYLTVGANVPEQIQKLADQLAEGRGAAFDRATAIEEFLAGHYREVADAPSGHAYPNLGYFLFGPRDRGGQVGTSEQFAASFALLARLTGLPSRVVVGFQTPAGGGTVTAGDALAWPEVLFEGLGWVAFDPLPKSDQPRPVEEDFTPKPSTPPPAPSQSPPAAESAAPVPSAVLAAPAEDSGPGTVVVAAGVSGLVVVVVLVGAAAVVRLRSARRRRRLTAGSPAQRITGAWLELADALRLAGRPLPAHLSATEAAEHAATPGNGTGRLRRAAPAAAPAPEPSAGPEPRRVEPAEWQPQAAVEVAERAEPAAERRDGGLPPLDELVAAVNTVGFAPANADHGQAERAAAQVIAYTAALRGGRSWWRRMWWSVHPGPLRWHRRR